MTLRTWSKIEKPCDTLHNQGLFRRSIVVADTSPLNYLIQIGCESLLPVLYERVMIPPAVLAELGDAAAPFAVRQWLLEVPEWIEVKRTFSPPDTSLSALDPGEQESIQLAEEQHADLLLYRRTHGVSKRCGAASPQQEPWEYCLPLPIRGSIDCGDIYHRASRRISAQDDRPRKGSFLLRSWNSLGMLSEAACRRPPESKHPYTTQTARLL